MKIEHKEVNFEDDRGTITDIFSHDAIEHATIIFSKKGSVRGNHYHKETLQQDFYVSGSVRMLTKKIDSDEITDDIVGAYDLVSIEENTAHEFIALEDSIFITFTKGIRGGMDYEKDVVRLETPLHVLKDGQ